MYNARALRCNSEQRKLHNPALKELPGSSPVHLAHDSPCVWKDHCPPTPVSACSCLSFLQGLIHCPLSSLKLILRTSDQKSSLLLLNPCCCFFFLLDRHLKFSSFSLFSVQAPQGQGLWLICDFIFHSI